MKQLVIFPRGSLSAKDKERMSKEGFLAIEAEDPSKAVVAIPGTQLATSDDLLLSALAGVEKASFNAPDTMARELIRRIKDRETKSQQTA